MSLFKDILRKTGIMQIVCDAVKENPFRVKATSGKFPKEMMTMVVMALECKMHSRMACEPHTLLHDRIFPTCNKADVTIEIIQMDYTVITN